MDWLTPTRRVVRWSPLIVVSALASGTLVLVRVIDWQLQAPVLLVLLAMLVIGALCGLRDPARDFVHPLPVSAGRRLTQRLIVVVPALACALLLVRWLANALFAVVPPAPGWQALAAFGTVGVAACAVLTRRLGTRAVDAVVSGMVVWLVAALSADRLDAPIDLVMPWSRWPVALLFVGALITVVATTCGVEA
jgi:hypothetical protein